MQKYKCGICTWLIKFVDSLQLCSASLKATLVDSGELYDADHIFILLTVV